MPERVSSLVLPDGLSAGEIFTRITAMLEAGEAVTEDRATATREIAGMLDGIPALADLSAGDLRDVVGAVAVLRDQRPASPRRSAPPLVLRGTRNG